jgi:hypothetical protein
MRSECRREFEAKYTAQQNVDRLVEIYQRAMLRAGEKPAPPPDASARYPLPVLGSER